MTGLVILSYDPATSARQHNLMRADALSHAARVSHARRRQKKELLRLPAQNEAERRTESSREMSMYRGMLQSKARQRLTVEAPLMGNRDPFKTTAVQVTPDLAYLWSKWQSYLAFNPIDATKFLTALDLQRDISYSHESVLNSKCLAFAAAAALLTRHPCNRTLELIVAQTKCHCLERIDAIIASRVLSLGLHQFASCLLLVVLGLYLLGDHIGAQAYARHLSDLLVPIDLVQDPTLLSIWCRLHYDDLLFSTRYVRRPMLGGTSLLQKLKPFLTEYPEWERSRLPPLNWVTFPTFSTALEDLFRRLQNQIDSQFLVPGQRPWKSDVVNGLSPFFINDVIDELVHHRDFSQEQILLADDGFDKFDWRIELLTTLCALAFLSCFTCGPKTPDKPSLRECGRRAMDALRKCLLHMSLMASNHRKFHIYQNLHLWAYYLGTVWECECMFESDETWFTPRLRSKVQELELGSWTELKSVVDKFLCVPEDYRPGKVAFLGMHGLNQAIESDDRADRVCNSPPVGEVIFGCSDASVASE
jgi:hypothetical protein